MIFTFSIHSYPTGLETFTFDDSLGFKGFLLWLAVSAQLQCYQCDENFDDDECWKEDNGHNYGRVQTCTDEEDACVRGRGGKDWIYFYS